MRTTDVMLKKWAKAGLMIFLGIILIIFLQGALVDLNLGFNMLFDGDFVYLFSLLSVVGWLLTILCFVSAAVALITSFREPKVSADDLALKLDAIERRMAELTAPGQPMGGAAMPVQGAATAGMPAAAQMEGKKGSTKRKVAAVAVVAIVIVAVLAVAFLFLGGGLGSGGGSTPEQAMSSFIDRMNAKDANGAIGNTIWTFSPDRGQYVDGLNQFFSNGTFHVSVSNQQIIENQDLNSSARSNAESQVDDLRQQLNVNISDYVVIELTVNMQTSQGSSSQDMTMLCVQVDGKWYVVFEFESQGPGQQSTPQDVFYDFVDRLNDFDAYGAANFTLFKFSQTFDQDVAGLEQYVYMGSSSYHLQVGSVSVKTQPDFNSSENSDMSANMAMASSEYGKSVQDYVIIHFTGTQTNDSGQTPLSEDLPCAKVDGNWYLIVGGGGQGPKIEVRLNAANASGNWTVSVSSVANASSPLSTGSIRLQLKYAVNGTEALNVIIDLIAGSYGSGAEFNDFGNSLQLDGGDQFILDSSRYFDGTEFKLTDPGGSTVYADIFL